MKNIKFKYEGVTGNIEITDAGAFVSWAGAAFWATSAKGGLRDAIEKAIK